MVYEIHHLEGFDHLSRMFNRDVTVNVDERGYKGHFGFEGLKVQSGEYPTVEEVLSDVIKRLHKRGFTGLRSRINFRDDLYLAERESWIHYNDSESPS